MNRPNNMSFKNNKLNEIFCIKVCLSIFAQNDEISFNVICYLKQQQQEANHNNIFRISNDI